jgi:hypothetical protein
MIDDAFTHEYHTTRRRLSVFKFQIQMMQNHVVR